MLILLLSAVIATVSGSKNPIWPDDFRWTSNSTKLDDTCLHITEPSSPRAHTWTDNYLCWKGKNKDLGFKWSYGGPISNMRCTHVHEAATPKQYTWHDNYICVPNTSPYKFKWSSAGPIRGLQCVQWVEGSDPHTWHDNYLCGTRVTPEPTPSPTPKPTPAPTRSPTEEASYGNIIEWLEKLIEEGNKEISDIGQVTEGLQSVLQKAVAELRVAEKAEAIAASAVRAAAKKRAEAEGALKACQKKYNAEKERLDEEIRIFTKVNAILSELKNGKQLVEKEKADVKDFISLADQADPVKVKAIMDLVSHLIRVNEGELKRIENDLKVCRERLADAVAKYNEAYGIWKAAVKLAEQKKAAVQKAQAELSAHKEFAAKRIAVIQDEIKQFNVIIKLLEPLYE